MPQSLSKVIIHIIFSTKDREPWLDRDVRPRMHAYIATICRDSDAEALHVGGVADHLHVVTTLPRTLCQAAIVETLKKTSSKLIEGAGFEIPAVLPATRLWRILSKPESAQCHSRIRRESGRAPSHPQLSRGVSRLFAQIRRRVRRLLCLGLKRTRRLIRAFSAGLWENNFSLGRCPRA